MWLFLTIKAVKQQKILKTIMGIIFWDFLMFDQTFLSRETKRSMIISNKHGLYELPHELSNELRLTVLGN